MKKPFNLLNQNKTKQFTVGLFAALTIIFLISWQTEPEKSLLWKVEKDSSLPPSYIFGTIHIIENDQYFFPDYMQDCFVACDALVTEILIDIPLKEQLAMAQRIILPENKSYKDFLSKKDYKKLKSYIVDTLGIKEKKFNRFIRIKPAYFSGLVLNEMLKKPTAYEQTLTKNANKASLDLYALETIYEQLDMLESIPDEEMFSYFSEDFNLMFEYNELINTYLNQDIHGIYKSIQEDESLNDFESQILSDRNLKWVPVLDSLISNKSCFIAVGAGHLPGEKGILKLLSEKGFKVTPVLE